MADLVITPADVVRYDGSQTDSGIAGEAITAGQTLYKHSDGKLYKADCSTAVKARAVGVALNGAAANQPVAFIRSGGLNPGAAVAVGTIYGVTDTAGGIGPVADRGTGDYLTILGVAVTTSRIDLNINRSEVAIA